MTMENQGDHLPYGRQHIDEADIRAVARALSDPFITSGPRTEAFEAALCRITGARFAVACANGTAALHLACLALEIGPGDLGVTSPISFLASANCVEYCGGRTDFIDIDPSTLCLSLENLADRCRRGKAPNVVIPVDFAGIPADLPGIKSLAERYGFYVIEDAAHALGSEYLDKGERYACGSCAHTDLSIFSFHPVKTVTTGEGGAVMTNSAKLASKLRRLRSHGMERPEAVLEKEGEWYYEMGDLGFNYRITDIQCALGLTQLGKLSGFKERRQKIVSEYNRAFRGQAKMILPPASLETDACPHLYPMQIRGSAQDRRRLFLALRDSGLLCQVHYIPIYWQPYYKAKYNYQRGKCPEAETYYQRCISLPLFPAMTDGDVQRVIQTVGRCLDLVGLTA